MSTEVDIEAGDVLSYTLRPEDLPTDPAKQWKGRVIKVVPEGEWTMTFFIVASLEPGYEGLREMVYPSQITRTEKGGSYGSETGQSERSRPAESAN